MKSVILISHDTNALELLRIACLYLKVKIIRINHAQAEFTAMRQAQPLAIFVDTMDTFAYNGWLTARRIKTIPHLQHVPVTILSDDDQAPEITLKVGCDHYLPRIIPIHQTRQYIQQLLLCASR